MDAVSYKCPSCGSALSFDSQLQKMSCSSCKNTYDISDLEDYYDLRDKNSSELLWNTYDCNSGNGDWSEQELSNMKVNTCPSCAAEIITDKTTVSTRCLYCGNPTIITNRVSGVYRPDYVIPFEVSKDEAIQKLKEFCLRKPLLSKQFKMSHSLESVTGVYVPFWLFNCNADAKIMYDAKRISHWSTSKYYYTKTDYYSLIREGVATFENLPVDASTKVGEEFMEAVEPFNYSNAVDFNIAYLSGFLADKYDIDVSKSQKRADIRIKQSMLDELYSTTSGYSGVHVKNINIDLDKNKTRYALLPIWLLNIKFNNKIYKLAVNGQTGKFAGELPVSKTKFTVWLLSLTAGISSIISIILFLMGGWG